MRTIFKRCGYVLAVIVFCWMVYTLLRCVEMMQ